MTAPRIDQASNDPSDQGLALGDAMPKTPKNPLLLADDSNWRCRESLRRAVERVVREALDEGWKPEDIAISLVEVADEHMDQMIGEAICPGHPIVIH